MRAAQADQRMLLRLVVRALMSTGLRVGDFTSVRAGTVVLITNDPSLRENVRALVRHTATRFINNAGAGVAHIHPHQPRHTRATQFGVRHAGDDDGRLDGACERSVQSRHAYATGDMGIRLMTDLTQVWHDTLSDHPAGLQQIELGSSTRQQGLFSVDTADTIHRTGAGPTSTILQCGRGLTGGVS